MFYVSLEFPVLKLRQSSTLIAQKGEMGITGVFNPSVIIIKIKNKTISTTFVTLTKISKNTYLI